MFEFCYKTLNAFAVGVCDGSFCGTGWKETSEYVQRIQWEDCKGDCRNFARKVDPVNSCGDVRNAIFHRPIGTTSTCHYIEQTLACERVFGATDALC